MTKKILNLVLAVILLFIVIITALLWNNQSTPASNAHSITIVIDPGHGGNDPGKVGASNVLEKDINLDISLKIAGILQEAGINVVMTRDGDYGLYDETDTNKKTTDLHNRCNLVKKSNATLMISIHQNSFSDSQVAGSQVFYYVSSSQSQNLAQQITDSIATTIGKENARPIKSNSDYYLLLNTPCPSVIIECGFLSNPIEAQKLTTTDYQLLLSQGISQGVLDFLNNND